MRLITSNYCTESATVVSGSNINPFYPVSNFKNPSRSKRVRTADGTTTMAVVFDLITTEAIDSVILLWSKEDGIKLTDTATVKIQANATNNWTSPALDQTITISNEYVVASHYFTSNQSYRYWRVLITDAGNPWNYIELGQVFLGKSEAVENAQNGFKFKLIDSTNVIQNEFGHKYFDEYPTRSVIEFDYKYLDYSAIQLLENAFRKNGKQKPVVIAIDPEETVFDKDHFMIYGLMGGQFGTNHVKHDLFNAETMVVEELS